MSRKWTLPTLICSFVRVGRCKQIRSFDRRRYIDGLPCNSACQSYMAGLPGHCLRGIARNAKPDHRGTGGGRNRKVRTRARPRVARHPLPIPARRRAPASRRRTPTLRTAKASNTKKTAASKSHIKQPGRKFRRQRRHTRKHSKKPSQEARSQSVNWKAPTGRSRLREPPSPHRRPRRPPNPRSSPRSPCRRQPRSRLPRRLLRPRIAALPATAGGAPAPAPRTIQQQVVEATGMADLVTAIGAGREAANKSDTGTESGEASDTDKTASGSPGNPDNLVALVLARSEINSLSDLNNKNIAIEEKQSAASGSVSAALMAAGAAEVQFSEGQAGAIDRLISGEVPAAVLTVASPEAAESFPDIAGFRIFRVPLSQRARL